tara:strand:- start:1897 stop:2871 length:975 start_codon:yes stop_codon:yes gene_type:complete
MTERVLVTGAGGFIGHHLVKYLIDKGYWVRAVDIKQPEYETSHADEFLVLDLRRRDNCLIATQNIDHVYNLAADMGGIGYITAYLADISRNNILINTHMLEASHLNEVSKYFYSSSACIYPMYLQTGEDTTPLKEDDAYPADAEEGYGWEKLFAEKLCQYYHHDFGMETRVARFHNVYGPLGTYDGGKEKAPAAICRKVALAKDGSEIEVWGDGQQTRSFMYIDDCVEGIFRIMQSDVSKPLNLGMDIMISVDGLVDLISDIAGKSIGKQHDLTKPQGVRGRNSDNSLLRTLLEWEPTISLRQGLEITYSWISQQIANQPAKRN